MWLTDENWPVLGGLATVCMVVGGFAQKMWQRAVHEGHTKAAIDGLQQKVKEAETVAAAAGGKIEMLINQLHAHQLEDAQSFAKLEVLSSETSRRVSEAEARLVAAIGELGDEIRSVGGRIDDLLKRKTD